MKKKVVFFVISTIFILLFLNACVPSVIQDVTKNGLTAKSDGVQNPLKGVELDLTAIDEMVTLLKLNDIILYRLQVSSDAKWPDELSIPLKDLDKTQIDYLEKKLKYDFSYMELYGDDSFSISDIASISKAADKLISKVCKKLGKEIEYAMAIIDGNMPFQKCVIPPETDRENCDLFDKPVEKVLFDSAFKGGIGNFIKEPIDSGCLLKATAIKGDYYDSFEKAFYSLLPSENQEELKTVEEQIEKIDKDLQDLQVEKEEKSLKLKEEKISNKDKVILENELTAIKKKITDKEKEQKTQIEMRQKTLKQARESIINEVGDEEKVAIARTLQKIAKRVNSNLKIAAGATASIYAKLFFDIKSLAQAGLNPLSLTQAMAQEAVQKGRAKTIEEAMKNVKNRVEMLLKRSVTLTPNLVKVTGAIISQKSMIADYLDYIDAFINAADKEKK